MLKRRKEKIPGGIHYLKLYLDEKTEGDYKIKKKKAHDDWSRQNKIEI